MDVFIPASTDCLMTFSHFSVSDLANAENSSGVAMIGVEPSSDSCDRIFVDVSPALISRFSFATTSVGVPRGTPTPYQMMASYPGTVSAIAARSAAWRSGSQR